MDNLGPFVKCGRGNEHIMVWIDSFPRYVTLYPLNSTTGVAIVNAMEDLVMKFGNPKVIVTDRGTCFTSKNSEEF